MRADEVKALRKELGCTVKELAQTLGVEASTVTAWEQGDAFATKKWVEAMAALRSRGPQAIVRKARRGAAPSPLQALADPALWALVRKLLAHAELRRAAHALAEAYPDPADE